MSHQVHLWGEQGATGGGDDSSSAAELEAAGGEQDHEGDVLLHREEAPGQSSYTR